MKLKQIFSAAFITAAALTLTCTAVQADEGDITVTVNGSEVPSENKPVIIEGTTFVPLRPAVEAMGYTIDWDDYYKTAKIYDNSYGYSTTSIYDENKTVTVYEKNDTVIVLQIDSNVIYKYSSDNNYIYDQLFPYVYSEEDYEYFGDEVAVAEYADYDEEYNREIPADELEVISCDMTPRVINGSTYIPLRVVAETLDAEVEWDQETRTVIIKTIPDTYYDSANNVTYELDNYETLTISGTGKIDYFTFTENYLNPFAENSVNPVKKVIIKDGITGIGEFAFYGYSNLTSITIPKSVTNIGYYAFYECDALSSITIPDSVTSIGEAAFGNCDNLTSVTIPAGVTNLGTGVFVYCSSLKDITVDSENSDYQSVDGVLYDKAMTTLISWPCGKNNVTIPENVTAIGSVAFAGCDNLTEIAIPENVTSVGFGAFAYCDNLTEITIPESVTSISGGTFAGCKSLTEITIPESVTSIGDGAFAECEYLSKITIPESVTSIGEYAFEGCGSLKTISLPSNITKISGGMFMLCRGLSEITIPDSVTAIDDYAFYDCDSLKSIVIPDSVKSIGNYAFEDSGLTEVTIPNSVTYIGNLAFYCNSLERIICSAGSTADDPDLYNYGITIVYR